MKGTVRSAGKMMDSHQTARQAAPIKAFEMEDGFQQLASCSEFLRTGQNAHLQSAR
jgi:hypothetical protein